MGITIFTAFLPQGQLTVSHMPAIAGGAALAGTVYTWLNFRLVSAIVRRLYPDRTMRPWSKMVGNQIALAVLGGYGALLGAAFELVGAVTLPLMLVTFLVGHVGFAAYSQLREAHEATIQGFVKAVEALDPYTRGHTERVAHFADTLRLEIRNRRLRRNNTTWLIARIARQCGCQDQSNRQYES